MQLITRDQWGARPPRQKQSLSHPRGVAAHWEGVSTATSDHSQCAAIVRVIQNYHMDVHNWSDIAYNMLCCIHSYVFEGRGLGIRSAANGTNDSNANYWAICAMVGQGDPQPPELFQGLSDAIIYCQQNGAGDELFPHHHFFQTDCPGDAITQWVTNWSPQQSAPQSQLSEDQMSALTITYPNGHKTIATPDGGIFNAGTPYFGSMFSLAPEEKQGFDHATAITAVDANNEDAGYIIWAQNGNQYKLDPAEWSVLQSKGRK